MSSHSQRQNNPSHTEKCAQTSMCVGPNTAKIHHKIQIYHMHESNYYLCIIAFLCNLTKDFSFKLYATDVL